MAKGKKPLPDIDQKALAAWFNSQSDKVQQATDPFYLQYGRTLDGWSTLENTLSQFFARLTGMTPKKAARIFYSARSFNGRADMFEAALSVSRLPKELRAFLKTALKTARTYSSFRNRLAHGEMNIHMSLSKDGHPEFVMCITEPKYLEQTRPEFGISLDDLKTADHRFRALAGDVLMALDGELVGPSLEKRRELILQRPTLPHSKAPTQTPAKRKRPPQPSRAKSQPHRP